MKSQSFLQGQVLAKADEDGDFRALLLSDPKRAIKDATGLKVPEGLNIHVLEDNATDLHLVLPPAGRQIPDSEMRTMAGRGSGWASDW